MLNHPIPSSTSQIQVLSYASAASAHAMMLLTFFFLHKMLLTFVINASDRQPASALNFSKNFQDFSSHQIFVHIHEALNIDKNKN